MFDWLNRLLGGQAALRPAPHIRMLAQHNTTAYPNLAESAAQARTYTQSPWVYVAVSRIIEAAALVPLHVYHPVDGEQVATDDHPMLRLLARPNPFTSRFDLFEQTLGMLELTGNAYWLLSGTDGTPQQIWPLRPDRVSVVPDADTYVRGYVYEVDGVRVPLEAAEVIHFKRWHPLNDYYGLSALEAAAVTVQTDRAMATWNRNTFGQDNGVPAGIVTLPETTNATDFERIKREWTNSYGGVQRRTAFLRAGEVRWQSMAQTHTDLAFLDGRQANRDEILNIFGVPVGMVSDNATEANAKVAERTFVERTLWPKLVRLANTLSTQLLPFYEADATAAFQDIRPTDTQARLAELDAAMPVLSINEIRARYYDLSPVPWGALPPEGDPAHAGNLEKTARGMIVDTPPTDTKTIADELRAWEKFTLKRAGQPDARPFAIETVPDDLAFEVSAELLAADDDPNAVKTVFRDARARLPSD